MTASTIPVWEQASHGEQQRTEHYDVAPTAFASLDADMDTDVCVIGAGIAGLTTAYLLTRSGQRVIVIDKDRVAGGETGRSTAHITNAFDDRYFELVRGFGEAGARVVAESHTAAIDLIATIVRDHAIDCAFERVDGYLFAAPGHTIDLLQREAEAARAAGLTEVKLTHAPPGISIGDPTVGDCLHFPRQAQFDPRKYVAGLAQVVVAQGGQIFTHSPVSELEGGEKAYVKTAAGARVQARAIVVATNAPINDRFVMHTKQAPYRTYALAFAIEPDSIARALYWDTGDPYHYVRTARVDNGEVLIVGGADHKCGQADDGTWRFDYLERWTREHFPQAGTIVTRWSGQVLEPIDGVAFIGRNPSDADNVFIVTGDSGNGITHGTLAGQLLCDLILGRPNHWADLYAPDRKNLHAVGEFVHENLNVAAQFGDWLKLGISAEAVACGRGAIVQHGMHKLAVYRDADNQLHVCNAACPHLGCVVSWNSTENSWDCPCHGSRFDPSGRVLSGPSRANLAPASLLS